MEYTVKPGDSCDAIAAQFRMSCAQVRALNPKSFGDAGDAYDGMTLCIGVNHFPVPVAFCRYSATAW